VPLDEGPEIVLDRAMVVVGRHPSCDTRLDSLRVSRQHCLLTLENGEVTVRDLRSTNGIRINGQTVTRGRLRHGDELSIANIRFRLETGHGHEQSLVEPAGAVVASRGRLPRGDRTNSAAVAPALEVRSIMTRAADHRQTARTLWRRFRRLVARGSEHRGRLVFPGSHSDAWSSIGDQDTEVFPWMEHAIVVGTALGAVVAFGLGRACHLELSGMVLSGALGAVAGAMGGICVALLWAVEMPSNSALPGDLYDPWLDGRESVREDVGAEPPIVEDAAEPAEEINYWRARVRPRVLSSVTGESLPLAEMVGPILEGREFGAIRLIGGPGSGKTTALDHLAGLVPEHLGVSFLDEPLPTGLRELSLRGWVVYTARNEARASAETVNLRLAGWGEDEWIEYLLASDRRLCASVMARLARVKDEAARLNGIPELWRLVLDRMLGDPLVNGPCSALRNELAALLGDAELRQVVEARCFHAVGVKDGDPLQRLDSYLRRDLDEGLFRLIRHRPVALMLAADHVAGAINHQAESEVLAATLHRDLVLEAAVRIARDPAAVDRLWSLVNDGDGRLHPTTASLLHALHIGWKPKWPAPRLAEAYLDNASWPLINLTAADMRGALLGGADLSGGRLDRANLAGGDLAGGNLCGCSMEGALLDKAELSRASLAQVRAEGARFEAARLVAANLVGANLGRAIFTGADLSEARLSDACLAGADLRSSKLEGADFSRADLRGAIMRGLKLTGAQFTGACFTGADLSRSDLEGMSLPGAAFGAADLSHALLTGSSMPGADFRSARLRAAGLAEVDWEGADLRGADLREADFHLGSSRSGLVGSPIACEGSRTGFYTDDFNEQEFKSPEEIRKANLCGADLRGARIDNVDFYLVDLRGALLDPQQIPHVRRCGAIFEARPERGK
jgi:uncharacterized protein YjbI with pentapeptide repeats